NIVRKIDATNPDKYDLFSKIATNYLMGSVHWSSHLTKASLVAGLIQITYAERMKAEIESGSLKIDETQVQRYVNDMFMAARRDFKKPSIEIGQKQWDSYIAMMKALFSKDEYLQKQLLLRAIDFGSDV